MPAQTLPLVRQQDTLITIQMAPVVDITGWAILFFIAGVANGVGVYIISKTTGAGQVVIRDGPGGTINVPLTGTELALIGAGGPYSFEGWRTDTASHQRICYGTVQLARTLYAP